MSLASTRLPRDMCEPTVNDTSTGQLSDAQIAQVPTSSHLQTAKLLLAGGVSGAVSKTATAPLARMTILYQVWTGQKVGCNISLRLSFKLSFLLHNNFILQASSFLAGIHRETSSFDRCFNPTES